MSKLNDLSITVLQSGKMSPENLVKHLVEAIEQEESCDNEYRDLYEAVYGEKINKELAESWVHSMSVADDTGVDGQHWTVDQCYDVGNKVGIDWNKHSKWEWYVVLNMMYSDYAKTASALGMKDDPMFFARLGKDWLCDSDAGENKLYNYYFNVVC